MRDWTELPTGTVTFLFSDIEGSTRLVQPLGDGYPALLDRHQRLLRRRCASRRASRSAPKGTPSSWCSRRGRGVAAAIEGQRGLERTRGPRTLGSASGWASTPGEGILGAGLVRRRRRPSRRARSPPRATAARCSSRTAPVCWSTTPSPTASPSATSGSTGSRTPEAERIHQVATADAPSRVPAARRR